MEIIADAQALDRGDGNAKYELSVATFRKPDAVIFKQRQTSTVSAWVCEQCGEPYFEEKEVDAIQDLIRSVEQKADALMLKV